MNTSTPTISWWQEWPQVHIPTDTPLAANDPTAPDAPGPTAINPPLRIALCLSLFHPIVGGAEWQMFQLAQRWCQQGHRVLVLTRAQPGQPTYETVAGMEIRRVLQPWSLGPWFGLTFVVGLLLVLWRSRRHWDIALAGQAPWEAIATGLAGLLLGKRTAVVLQQSGPFGDIAQLRRAKGFRWLVRPFLANDLFFALAQHGAEELVGLLRDCQRPLLQSAAGARHPKPSCCVVTSGVDADRFQPRPRSQSEWQTVLFVGRLVPQKNPQVLLHAWRQLEQHGLPSAASTLWLVGDGPMRPELEAFCQDHQLQRVRFLGRQADMPAIYAQAGIFVLPSVGEGCPNALVEAMASGLCPIVSAIGGMVDVVTEGETGRLVPMGEAAQLAAALRQLLQQPTLAQQLALAARQRILERHHIEPLARYYLWKFCQLLNQPKISKPKISKSKA